MANVASRVALARSGAAGTVIVSSSQASRWRIVPGGTVERSTDGGSTWQAQETGATVTLAGGASPAPSICWLVGPTGTVLLSTDGRSWQRIAFPEATDLISVRATDEKNAAVTESDGRTFTTTSQLRDRRLQHLLLEMNESSPLVRLIDIQTALAWDVLHIFRPETFVSREAYVNAAPPIRLDAFENYVRGTTATTAEEQVQHFREAVRLNPTYPEALLQLGKAYYRGHQYEQAISALARVPEDNPLAREANFYLGLAAYNQGDSPRADSAFRFVAARLPLAEVYNNLGVVSSRASRKTAAEYFQKAIDADPNDPDYHFNLAIELYRTGGRRIQPNARHDLAEAWCYCGQIPA